MFTGIVEEIGHVRQIARQGEFQRMQISAQRVLEDVKMGDSINVDGVCQTVVHFDAQSFSVETVSETLSRTTLGQFQSGRPVNLERAYAPEIAWVDTSYRGTSTAWGTSVLCRNDRASGAFKLRYRLPCNATLQRKDLSRLTELV